MPETKPSAAPQRKHRDLHDWVATIGILLTFVAAAAAAVFTGIAASYTGRQWQTADDMEKRQLRAYVTETTAYVARFEVGSTITTVANVRNFGITPAFHFGTKGFTQIVLRSPTNVYDVLGYRFQERLNAATIYPAQDHEMTMLAQPGAPVVTDDQRRLVEAGADVIVSYGTMYYDDIFGKPWATDYCFFFIWNDIAPRRWSQCRNHQGADDEAEGELSKQ